MCFNHHNFTFFPVVRLNIQISVAGKVFFIAVGSTGLIYLSSDGGVNWASAATDKGSLTGTIQAHDMLMKRHRRTEVLCSIKQFIIITQL